MKKGIHPKYIEATVTCGCGESFKTRSTREKIQIGICSKCHPFFTGKQKFVDAAGQVEKFQKKFKWTDDTAKDVEAEALNLSRKKALEHKKEMGKHRREREEAKVRFKKAGAVTEDKDLDSKTKPKSNAPKKASGPSGAPPAKGKASDA